MLVRLALLARLAACAPWPSPLARAFLVHVPKCAGASLKAELQPLFAAHRVAFESKEQCYPYARRRLENRRRNAAAGSKIKERHGSEDGRGPEMLTQVIKQLVKGAK